MRSAIAEACFEHYGMKLLPEDVNDCDGCRVGKRLFSGCSACEIRKCAVERKVESCAYCGDFECEKLQKHLKIDPDARGRLEKLRSIS